MYVYLSKKITVQNNTFITASSWNRKQGYVAAGTESGLIKVIKLEVSEGKDPKARDAKSSNTTNLLMNASLEGHTSQISCIAWNDVYNKLTTADTNGRIVIWNCHRNEWTEEMVNKRDMIVVTSMKWSADGEHICIVYNDGVIIMGSVEGNRIWVKDLKNTALTNIEVKIYYF
ncbi:unnamed protein product [Brachionus calyciflorus]|uniref:IFT121/TULP4 N-terminal domain-containing protein n=1 Tax=Brachionus calyciflorus TaxID=104777 RepID=A0A813PY87_9BILA|nr:unnamed protein product [Brachionus calyciflorus]